MISSFVIVLKFLFLGKYCLISPLVFSFKPRSYDAYEWAKYLGICKLIDKHKTRILINN